MIMISIRRDYDNIYVMGMWFADIRKYLKGITDVKS